MNTYVQYVYMLSLEERKKKRTVYVKRHTLHELVLVLNKV